MSDTLALSVAETLNAREETSRVWNLRLETARAGFARVRMHIRRDMLNGHAIAHGGLIFALADTAFAYACNSRNVSTVGAQASIVFLSPVHEGEELVAQAHELATAGRSGAYIVHVTTADGRAIAEFQGLSRTIGGTVVELENK